MKLLLDTHALLWFFADDRRLSRGARDGIEDPRNEVLVSVISLWEIVLKQRIGKLHLAMPMRAEQLEDQGFALVSVRPAHLCALEALPMHHRDPFDQLLIAQAISEDAIFVSSDSNAAMYPVQILA